MATVARPDLRRQPPLPCAQLQWGQGPRWYGQGRGSMMIRRDSPSVGLMRPLHTRRPTQYGAIRRRVRFRYVHCARETPAFFTRSRCGRANHCCSPACGRSLALDYRAILRSVSPVVSACRSWAHAHAGPVSISAGALLLREDWHAGAAACPQQRRRFSVRRDGQLSASVSACVAFILPRPLCAPTPGQWRRQVSPRWRRARPWKREPGHSAIDHGVARHCMAHCANGPALARWRTFNWT